VREQAAPALSIVIPTLNRGRVLQKTVEQVLAQPFTDFELLIVDQSDPPIREQNEAYLRGLGDSRVLYLHVATKNLPNARNEGLARITADVVLFLDDDVILLSDDFLQAHLRAFADPSVGGVTGRVVERALRSNSPRTATHVTWGGRTVINLAGFERCEIAGLKGANMSFRSALFARVGGFDRNFVGSAILEDVDMSFRVRAAGLRLLFEPRAEVLHLSAPAGGVRVTDAIARECWRFQLTCYFLLKQRGPWSLVPFAATFGAIGLIRALQWRSPHAARELWAACRRGWAAWRRGPDEALPHWPAVPEKAVGSEAARSEALA
jgi:GT2 family glycosyltransferase